MKIKGYKPQIEQILFEEHWEIQLINSCSEWWDDEHWRMRHNYDSTLSFYLCFIVDPMFEGKREKGHIVRE